MAKLTLADLVNLQNEQSATTTLNSNSALIEAAIENTLSRDGTSPNQMNANLDMNSNRILNLPTLEIAAATSTTPQIHLSTGGPPTSPANGDIWFESNTNTGFKIRVNGVTKTIVLA